MTLEEYLDGEEFDVDCLLSESEIVYAGVVYNMPQTFCKEVGSQVPPPFPEDKQAELVSFTHRCLDALGFANGAFHVELKYTSAGPRLIEINARIGGGFNYQMNRMVWGVDLVEQYLMTCLGLPIRPLKPATPLICVAESDMPCPHSGVIARDDFLDGIASDPPVLLCKTKVHTGQRVIGPEDGVPGWLGELLVSGHSVDAAKQALDELLERVESPIQRYS